MKQYRQLAGAAALFAASLIPAHAQFVISEVDAAGSGNSNYAADWFELRNTGAATLDLTGWRMDDSSASFANSVALRGVTSLAPGQVAVFLESNASGTTDASIDANFITAWFGASAPAGFTLGNYGGSGVGLSTTADGVNIFDSTGNLMASVSFGAAPSGATFDNAAGLTGLISQPSILGVNGAFQSFNAAPAEVGSPGLIPEPAVLSLGALGLGMLALRQRVTARR